MLIDNFLRKISSMRSSSQFRNFDEIFVFWYIVDISDFLLKNPPLIIGGQFRFSHLWYPKYRQSFGNIFLFCFWLIYRPKNPPLIIDGLHHLRYLKYRLSFSNIFWFLIFSSPVVPWLCIPEIYMLKIWSPTKNK